MISSVTWPHVALGETDPLTGTAPAEQRRTQRIPVCMGRLVEFRNRQVNGSPVEFVESLPLERVKRQTQQFGERQMVAAASGHFEWSGEWLVSFESA